MCHLVRDRKNDGSHTESLPLHNNISQKGNPLNPFHGYGLSEGCKSSTQTHTPAYPWHIPMWVAKPLSNKRYHVKVKNRKTGYSCIPSQVNTSSSYKTNHYKLVVAYMQIVFEDPVSGLKKRLQPDWTRAKRPDHPFLNGKTAEIPVVQNRFWPVYNRSLS